MRFPKLSFTLCFVTANAAWASPSIKSGTFQTKGRPNQSSTNNSIDAIDFAALNQFSQSLIDKYKVPGIALGIVYRGKLIFAEGYGYRDAEKKLPVTTQTLFGIGSNSKAFTSFAAGLLVDQNILDWDTPIQKVLANFQLEDASATQQATLRDALLHRSGQARHDLMWLGSPFSRENLFYKLRFLEPNLRFREKYQYSNLMYMAAGHMVETAAKISWDKFIEDRIFTPLEMTSSDTSTRISQLNQNVALPYSPTSKGFVRRSFRVLDNMGPAGSINSNLEDMAKWVSFHLSGQSENGKALLKLQTLKEMHRAQIDVGDSAYNKFPEFGPLQYGLAWRTHTYRGAKIVRHGGSIGGYLSTIAMIPDLNVGIIVMQNIDHFEAHNYIALRAYDTLLGLAPIDWISRLEAQHGSQSFELSSSQACRHPGFWEEENLDRVDRTQSSLCANNSTSSSQNESEKSFFESQSPLTDYVGQFLESAYGPLQVEIRGKELFIKYNDWSARLSSQSKDTFMSNGTYSGSVKFGRKRGKVDSVSLKLESSVAEIIFDKK